MSLNSAIYHYLQTRTGLTALVSTRVYPSAAPSSVAKPYITYVKISSEHTSHQTASSGLAAPLYQFDVWADSALSAEAVYEQLRLALDTFSGTMGTGAYATTVERVIVQDDDEGHEPPKDGSQQATYRHRIDVTIWHRETVPTFS